MPDLSNHDALHSEFSRAAHEALNAIFTGNTATGQAAADDLGVCLAQAQAHGHVASMLPQVSLALCLRGILAQWLGVSLTSD